MARIFLTVITLLVVTSSFSQSIQDIRLTDRLVYHFPFDGDMTDLVHKSASPLTSNGTPAKQVNKGHLKYQNDQFIRLERNGLSYLGLREELADKDSVRTYGFWFQAEFTKEKSVTSADTLHTLATLQLFDIDSLKLRLSGQDKTVLLSLERGTAIDTFCLLTPGKWYYCLVKISFDTTRPDFAFDIFSLVPRTPKATLQEVAFVKAKTTLSDLIKTYIAEERKIGKNTVVTWGFYPTDHQVMDINDLRVYERELSRQDMDYLAQFSINDGREDLKFQLALVYKKLADEFFMADKRKTAADYYKKAGLLTDVSADNSIEVTKMNGNAKLNTRYFTLLQKDIAYRKSLLEGGYSFWGIEFSTSPMIPTNEVTTFITAFDEFASIYDNISQLQQINQTAVDQSLKIAINKSKDRYQHEIDQQKQQISDAKLGFYNDQIVTLKNRLTAIEAEQEDLSNRVKKYEEDLKRNEEKLVSTLTKAVSESAIGVRIDNIPDLSKNFKETAFGILNNNPTIKATLLGSANDLINTAQASYDYYNKAKQGLNAVKATLNKNIYPEQIIGLGDAVAGMGFLDQNTLRDWNQVKRGYKSLEDLKSQATSIIEIASRMKNGNFESWTHLTDFIARSGYFPEYEKAFASYVDFPRAAYEAFQSKKYDALLKLGASVLDSINTTVNIKRFKELKNEIESLPARYKQLKPLFTAIQKSGTDSIIKLVLFETVFDPNVVVYFKDLSFLLLRS